ncbi:hypothetical protein [Mycobacterium sp.]|uniref:hypothetical protein n=1 Tax=Mycobacterium sp. TaxID=1785 RepID=UPI0012220D0D|nr:hypothetical protein [Mycobacterium sp.]TAM63532.1 MAG: hypothetical protein EPN51_26535 [Mycobacterium sp.]
MFGRQIDSLGEGNSMTTVVNLINEVFGTKGTNDYPNLAANISRGQVDARVSSFLDAWRQWATDWTPPEAKPHAIRPYALAQWLGDPGGELAGAWRSLPPRHATADVRAELLHAQFLRHLLYCDAIALPDPLFGAAALTPALPLGMADTIEIQRAAAAETISRLAPFASLFENDVLIIVPYAEEVDLPTDLIVELSAIADTVDAEFPRMPPDWFEISYARRAAIDLAAQISAVGGEFEPYLPSHAHNSLLRALCQMVNTELRKKVVGVAPENRLYSRVIECQLPDPIGLELTDVVAIRRSGDFEVWRKAVSEGILRAEQLLQAGDGNETPGLDVATTQEIANSVNGAAQKMVAKRGELKPALGYGLDAVGVGGAVAGAALATGPLVVALAGLAGLGLVARAVARWRSRRPNSFTRHVAVFGNAART